MNCLRRLLTVLTTAWLLAASPTLAQQSSTPVRVQLSWYHQFQFAAFYAAIDQGFYRDVGLDVSLLEGGLDTDVASLVAAGEADFGVGNASLLVDRFSGKPVVAVAALMQHSPVALLARRTAGIQSIKDLQGKRIQCRPTDCLEVTALLQAAGVKTHSVRFTSFTSKAFIERLETADATAIDLTNEGFQIRLRPDEFITFNARDVGFDPFGDILFTSDKLARDNELVDRFRAATLKGHVYAMNNPDAIIRLIKQKYDSQYRSIDRLRFEADSLRPLSRTDIVEPGYMSTFRWEAIRDAFHKQKLVSANFPVDDFLYQSGKNTDDIDALSLYLVATLLSLVALTGIGFYIYTLNRRLLNQQAELREANAQLRELAHYDPLTKVPNRLLFADRVSECLKRAERYDDLFALLLIDLDSFKPVNDTYGHDVGDELLKVVAQRMQAAIRKTDSVGRIGGDEFVVLFRNINSADSALELSRKVADSVAKPIHIGELELTIAVSGGIAVYPSDGKTAFDLTKCADERMYAVKRQGGHAVWAVTNRASVDQPISGHSQPRPHPA